MLCSNTYLDRYGDDNKGLDLKLIFHGIVISHTLITA